MTSTPTREGFKLVQIPFQGFYESAFSAMIDDAMEQYWQYNDSGDHAEPDEVYFNTNYRRIQNKMVKSYVESFNTQYEDLTGVTLGAEFESMESPREYNFSTDRIFVWLPDLTIAALFTASEANNHVELAKHIKDNCTSYSGFHSWYSNDFGDWLAKPVNTWDHNEYKILLEAVLNIGNSQRDIDHAFDPWDLFEFERGNGIFDQWIYEAMPKKLTEFADIQREYGKPLDYAIWDETGIVREVDSDEPLPPLRCKNTLELI